MNALELTRSLLADSLLWTHPQFPFQVQVEPGLPHVLLIAGENGTGKSLLAQSLTGWGRRHHKISGVSVSIRERTGAGLNEMAAMRRVMMFGDESEQSTGATSAMVIETAFRTLKTRAQEGSSAFLVLDEPEMGLSRGYTFAMGAYLAKLIRDLDAGACGVAIVTHSRDLTTALIEQLGARPSFLKTGESQGFDEWLKAEPARTVEELLALPMRCHDNRRKVAAVLKASRGG